MKTIRFRLSSEDAKALERASTHFELSKVEIVVKACKWHYKRICAGRIIESLSVVRKNKRKSTTVFKFNVPKWVESAKFAKEALLSRLKAEGCYDADFDTKARSVAGIAIDSDDKKTIEDGLKYVEKLTKEVTG